MRQRSRPAAALCTLRLVSVLALCFGCGANTYVSTVTLPRIERGLKTLMEIPFEAINFLMPMYEFEFQNYTESERAWELLYAQVPAQSPALRQLRHLPTCLHEHSTDPLFCCVVHVDGDIHVCRLRRRSFFRLREQ